MESYHVAEWDVLVSYVLFAFIVILRSQGQHGVHSLTNYCSVSAISVSLGSKSVSFERIITCISKTTEDYLLRKSAVSLIYI